jgi:hypothetical protein
MQSQVYRKTEAPAIEQCGVDGFIASVSAYASAAKAGWWGTVRFLLQIGEAYAYIRLQDLYNPLRFLKQLEGEPPVRFGTEGFNPAIIEPGDANPARHYTAFLFVGFWLPPILSVPVLYWWEVLGFFRYRFHWSDEDMRSGFYAIHHGGLVRRYGPTVLPGLIARDLAQRDAGCGIWDTDAYG